MEKIGIIKQEVNDLLEKMGVKFTMDIREEGPAFFVQINTETDAPYLIGKHGEMVQALQRVFEAILYNKFNEDVTLMINVNDYREKQKERLEKITDNVATRVTAEDRSAYLNSFTAYERKIIHEFISNNYPDLKTVSEGEGAERKLVISKK
jgi:spoIIIJ-associated protein